MFDKITREDLTEDLQRLFGDREILLAVRYGSALYGTETPQSDNDIRVVFLPTPREILLGEVDFSIDSNADSRKLGQGDNDIVGHSLKRFLEKLGKCDMTVIEMLFASRFPHATLHKNRIIDWIYNSRNDLIGLPKYSLLSNPRANLGALAPDNKHTAIFQDTRDAFSQLDPETPLMSQLDLLDGLADNNRFFQVRFHDHDVTEDAALEIMLEEDRPQHASYFYSLCNRLVDLSHPVRELNNICDRVLQKKKKELSKLKNYQDLDFKDVYHGLRVLDQIIELAVDDDLTFPRPNANFLRRVRSGELTEGELRREVTFYYDNALEAEQDLPFPDNRNIETYEAILTRIHKDAILKS